MNVFKGRILNIYVFIFDRLNIFYWCEVKGLKRHENVVLSASQHHNLSSKFNHELAE